MNAATRMTIFADTYGTGNYGSCGAYSSGSCATTQTNNTTAPSTTNTSTPSNTTNSTTTNTTNSTGNGNTQSNQPQTFTITPASQTPKSTSHLGLEIAIGATVIGIAIFGTVLYRIIVRKRQKSLFYPTHDDDAGPGDQQHR